MTTDEKRVKVGEFCDSQKSCRDCICGVKSFCDGYTELNAPDEVIDEWYDFITKEDEEEIKPTELVIKDSGERSEFTTGAVRDLHEGKGRMDLIPWSAIIEVSKHCENGAKKYGEHNVDKGIPIHSFIDSAFRHLAKYTDGWVDEPHLVAAAWNILWAIQTEIKHPELKDIPWKEQTDESLCLPQPNDDC